MLNLQKCVNNMNDAVAGRNVHLNNGGGGAAKLPSHGEVPSPAGEDKTFPTQRLEGRLPLRHPLRPDQSRDDHLLEAELEGRRVRPQRRQAVLVEGRVVGREEGEGAWTR